MEAKVFIANAAGTKLYQPAVTESIDWTLQRRSTPGKLKFSIVADSIALSDISEGSAVQLWVDNKKLVFGFIFSMKQDKGGTIEITAYDQLRYLKNKDTYVYENKTASQFIKMIASDFRLKTGEIENTEFVIESRVEENTSLFDMIESALDLTLSNTKQIFVLYDDFGKLTLRNLSSMYVGDSGKYLMIDEESGENFEYTTSIDSDTYNKVKLTYDNEDTGKREVYIAQDSNHMNEWGVLQYFDTLSEGENGKTKADSLLSLYNKKSRKLKISGAIGDTRVRAGSLVIINMDLGSIKLKKWMLVDSVTHNFELDRHTMDLTLEGGDFSA